MAQQGIIGSLISERINRRKLLAYWITFGFLTTILLMFFEGPEFAMVASVLLGISFGFGFPTCQAFLTEFTTIEERGRVAGWIVFITFFTVIFLLIFIEALQLSLIEVVLICAVLKGSTIFALLIEKSNIMKDRLTSWTAIIHERSFATYAIPWFIFHIANGIALFGVVPPELAGLADYVVLFSFVGTLITALVAGLLVDRIGRKQPMLGGLLMLGITYALFALVTNDLTYIVVSLVEGIAWGLIAVSYMIVVLSDLSSKFENKERYYALGGILIPLLTYTIFSAIQRISQITYNLGSLSAVLCIIIFIAVLPLLRAPETLPEKTISKRRLKEHMEELGKVISETDDKE